MPRRSPRPMNVGSLDRYRKGRELARSPAGAASLHRMSDADLASLVAQGNDDALTELHDRHSAALMQTALGILRHRHDAEETLQEVFLFVWRKAQNYDPARASVSTWLRLITRCRSLDRLRRRQGIDRTAAKYSRHETGRYCSAVGFSRIVERERRGLLGAALARLPGAQRQVLELFYFRGLTQTETAKAAGIPLGTVKTRASLAIKKLRRELGEGARQLAAVEALDHPEPAARSLAVGNVVLGEAV